MLLLERNRGVFIDEEHGGVTPYVRMEGKSDIVLKQDIINAY